MTESDFKKHLAAAEKSPKEVAAATLGLPDAALRFKPTPETWCILEILSHLADIEMVLGFRIRQILAEQKPVIAPVDEKAWATELNYTQNSAPETIALFGLLRHANLQILRRIKLTDLNKSAYHPELKKDLALWEIVERLDVHSANHLQQIERLKKEAARKPN